jgi:hypothetical protein
MSRGIDRVVPMLRELEFWPLAQALVRSGAPWLGRASGLLGLGSIALLCLYLMIAMILVMLVGLGLA